MVAAREHCPKLTPEEYFAWEEQQEIKHEYFDGEVFAMSGGTQNHERISVRIVSLIDSHLDEDLYRKSTSLREYALISVDKIAIDLHRKDDFDR